MNSKNQINFISSCPKGHLQTFHWPGEQLRTALKCGTLKFHCMKCGEDWFPSRTEGDDLEGLLAEREGGRFEP
jgi:hypothetical protein